MGHYGRLSKEASDQLVRYLYLLIDDIQFSQTYRYLVEQEKSDDEQPAIDFDAPLPFGNK